MSLYGDFIADYQFEYDFPYGAPCNVWTTKYRSYIGNIGKIL